MYTTIYFSKVIYVVTLHSKYARALTFENLFLAIRLAKGYFLQLASCRHLRVVKPPPPSPLPRSPLTRAR